jgi:vancomycin resistance protein YoaR
VVSWYGAPGMDATIFTPSVDFKFRNDTNAFLLVQPSTDTINGVNTFNFYGTKPNRQVTIGEPVITDVKEPGAPVYRVDESLATGQKRQVEYAQRGMTVTVERTVTENGQSRVDKIVSKYQPWNAVFLVGPGTDVPQSTATP